MSAKSDTSLARCWFLQSIGSPQSCQQMWECYKQQWDNEWNFFKSDPRASWWQKSHFWSEKCFWKTAKSYLLPKWTDSKIVTWWWPHGTIVNFTFWYPCNCFLFSQSQFLYHKNAQFFTDCVHNADAQKSAFSLSMQEVLSNTLSILSSRLRTCFESWQKISVKNPHLNCNLLCTFLWELQTVFLES